MNVQAFATKVATVGVTLQQGEAIVSEVISLIILVEQAAGELSGDQKFQTVIAGLGNVIDNLGLTSLEAKIKQTVGPIVSVIVSIYNFLKLWPKPAVVVAATSTT